ncbi:hypothetical protein [Winogradskyella sp. MIT101101]|uniref:hypothetical protein n=1 Tax=Winogradskyella sp. MIT101101 TaxID=3098297 RepID=UPI00399AFC0C
MDEFMQYVMSDASHSKEMKLIFSQILEGLNTKKYGQEPFGTKAMKPFLNRENDRIICKVAKRKNKKQCIVMSEIHYHKKTQSNNRELNNRYKIVSNYVYEIIE